MFFKDQGHKRVLIENSRTVLGASGVARVWAARGGS